MAQTWLVGELRIMNLFLVSFYCRSSWTSFVFLGGEAGVVVIAVTWVSFFVFLRDCYKI